MLRVCISSLVDATLPLRVATLIVAIRSSVIAPRCHSRSRSRGGPRRGGLVGLSLCVVFLHLDTIELVEVMEGCAAGESGASLDIGFDAGIGLPARPAEDAFPARVTVHTRASLDLGPRANDAALCTRVECPAHLGETREFSAPDSQHVVRAARDDGHDLVRRALVPAKDASVAGCDLPRLGLGVALPPLDPRVVCREVRLPRRGHSRFFVSVAIVNEDRIADVALPDDGLSSLWQADA
mmetsp:Transcript_66464/g.188681  ORF Transcript_66464/g.188681 Transcript_66464/m.188681 type:complete len:239 (+) Transcript_66464:240-956(+)